MIVVSNTSPLNYLVLIGDIELLPKLFGRVIIPQAVLDELRSSDAPDAVRQWSNAAPPWLQTRSPAAIDASIKLGAGETEAISLAMELKADELLLDDKKARNLAFVRGLAVAGTLNILDAAADRELIDLPNALIRLLRTNFRAPADLVKEMLDRDAARRGKG
jgi:predicted nucleic acid-binding protein